MTNKFREGLVKGYVLGCFIGLMISVAFFSA